MKLKEYTSHDFEYLAIEMTKEEAAEVIEKLSKLLGEAMRGQYSCGFYGEERFNVDKGDGYPEYLNHLLFRINAPKKGKE